MKKSKSLNPKNIHQGRYDFPALIKASPELKQYTALNHYGDLSIDFANAQAVMSLNCAILQLHYGIKNWKIPEGHLCPPIPGRVDYIHYLADFINGDQVRGIDIGTGASCIYPLLGTSIYGWHFIASDIDPNSLKSAKTILSSNPQLKQKIECRLQPSAQNIFINIINEGEKYDFCMCNPPFHSSLEEASLGSAKKVHNLLINKLKKGHTPVKKADPLNFGGKKAELWCPGGEVSFINSMIKESVIFKNQCRWFTTLVSKKEHLFEFKNNLKEVKAKQVKTIMMHAGQKISHILIWSFN